MPRSELGDGLGALGDVRRVERRPRDGGDADEAGEVGDDGREPGVDGRTDRLGRRWSGRRPSDSVGRGSGHAGNLKGTDPRTPVAKQPTNTAAPSAGAENDAPETAAKAGKGAPTPSRAEQEAARKRPLVPNDRKEAAKQARAKQAEARERARVGMAAGDDRYLPARDRGPQKKYVRDYVDARFSIGEVLIPVMFLVILLTLIPTRRCRRSASSPSGRSSSSPCVDVVILGFLVTRKLEAKFGEDKVERVRWYAAMRALQLRPLRLPKPQVKRGQYPS